MPSFFTHYLCAKRVIDFYKDHKIYSVVEKYKEVYNLGAQGPDILFFHNQWPWKKDKTISELGGTMHVSKVNDFFANLLEFIDNLKDKDLIVTYLMGFCCHYALDTSTHPYIFYTSGADANGGLDDYKYVNFHREFEAAIDFLMCKREENKTPYELKANKIFKLNGMSKDLISDLFEYSIYRTYNQKINKNDVITAINDFYYIVCILRDKYGIKKSLIAALEKLIGIKNKPSSIVHPIKVNEKVDYLNLSKSKWCLPWDNKAVFYDSFIERYDLAIKKTIEFYELIIRFWEGVDTSKELLNKLGNMSYSTGESCDEQLKFIYHDSVYERQS